MKNFVGFAFAFLVLSFTASAGFSWDNCGRNYGYNQGYGYRPSILGAVSNFVRHVEREVGLLPSQNYYAPRPVMYVQPQPIFVQQRPIMMQRPVFMQQRRCRDHDWF